MSRRARHVGIIVAALLAVGMWSGAHAQYAGGLTLSTDTAAPGASVTVRGTGYAPNAAVSIVFDDTSVGTAEADDSGSFAETITIPLAATPGAHTISATGEGVGGRSVTHSAEITVTAPPTRGGGGSVLPLVIVGGLAAIGLGAIAVIGRMRLARGGRI